ncbi:glycerol-3-phosphate acyltransferase [bacterium]|nr:glycerol-3-phosphate acyltransferase [bacterium]
MLNLFFVAQLFLAYLIGSIPSGFLVARLRGIKNICKHGSGTIGATNVARVLGRKYFIVVFLADVLKASIYLLFLKSFLVPKEYLFLSAGAFLLGNTRSIFLNFQGGKGIATFFGLLLIINPLLLSAVVIVWIVSLFITRTIGIASVVACAAAPIVQIIVGFSVGHFVFVLLVSLWCIFLHRDNIKKYINTL